MQPTRCARTRLAFGTRSAAGRRTLPGVAACLLLSSLLVARAGGAQEEVAPEEADSELAPPAEPDGVEEGAPSVEEPESRSAGAGQGDRAAAESLARVGRGLMDLGQYPEACPKLEQSIEAAPSGPTALLLGECLERLGRIASAWASYRQAAALLTAGDDPAAAEMARQHALRLEPLVPKLTISAGSRPPGMEVWRDDTRFGAGVLGVPLAVDPGSLRIEARAPDHRPWSTTVAIRPSERLSVVIPALTPIGQQPVTVRVDSSSARGGLFLAGVISAGAGIAAMATGALLGASAGRDVNRAEADDALCGAARRCTPAGRELIDEAEAKALGSTLALSLGAVALVGGFVMVLIDPAVGSSAPETGADSAAALTATPWAGLDGGGMLVELRF